MLHQHPHHHCVTPISVNTFTAEADSHISTPLVPFSSGSLHARPTPGLTKRQAVMVEGKEGKGQL